MLIGAVGGVLVVFSILGLDRLKIDDPVGAISVHGVVGIWGCLIVPATNADAAFGAQLLGVVCIFAWVFFASLIVWAIIKAVMGLRVTEEEEYEGVDVAECGLEATRSSPARAESYSLTKGAFGRPLFFPSPR